MQVTLIAVSVAYFGVLIAISIWGYRRTHTEVDFLAAGRTIGPIVGGAVLAATQISAGTYVGTFGRHYLTGISWYYVWAGMWSGWMISAVWVAPKLRSFGALTVPDYIGARFRSETARILSAALIIVAYTIYLVAQFQASGEIAQTIFGTSPIVGMLIIIASTAVYTLLGGVKGSSYIELVQAMIMVGGLAVAVPVLLHQVGGVAVAWGFLEALDTRLTGMYYSWKELVGFSLAFGLSIASAPYTLTRFYSMRDEKTARRAIAVSVVFQFLIGTSVLILGMLMRVLFPFLASPDQASSVMAFRVLTPLAGSLVLVAMMSAIMSTCNSVLLVVAAGFAHDIYAKIFRPASSDRHLVRVNRWSVLLLSLVPAYFALQKYTDVQSIVVVQAKLVASFFFVPVVIGLNWKRATAPAAVTAMLTGFLSCLACEAFWPQALASRGLDSVEVGVVTSLIAFIMVSRYTRPVAGEHLAAFFGRG